MQVSTAVSQTQKIINDNKSTMNKVYFTGHSLGGFIAAWVGSEVVDGDITGVSKSNMKTYTFNAPGLSPKTNLLTALLTYESTLKIASDKLSKYDSYI